MLSSVIDRSTNHVSSSRRRSCAVVKVTFPHDLAVPDELQVGRIGQFEYMLWSLERCDKSRGFSKKVVQFRAFRFDLEKQLLAFLFEQLAPPRCPWGKVPPWRRLM